MSSTLAIKLHHSIGNYTDQWHNGLLQASDKEHLKDKCYSRSSRCFAHDMVVIPRLHGGQASSLECKPITMERLVAEDVALPYVNESDMPTTS